jgi:hypothetical protein
MYDSRRGFHETMLASPEYAEYRRCGGAEIRYGKICEAVCWCMDDCDFTECADPVKTIFKVSIEEVLAKEIEGWLKAEEGDMLVEYKDFVAAVKGGEYSFRKYTLCPKVRIKSLELGSEEVWFHKQECAYHQCSECGWDEDAKGWRLAKKWPALARVLSSTEHTVKFCQYQPMPRGINKTTKKLMFQDELVTTIGTRADFMHELTVAYYNCLPHQWNDDWLRFQRNYFPKVMTVHEMGVFTDFAAIFKHKQAFTPTCSSKYRSHLDVSVAVHSPRTETRRVFGARTEVRSDE